MSIFFRLLTTTFSAFPLILSTQVAEWGEPVNRLMQHRRTKASSLISGIPQSAGTNAHIITDKIKDFSCNDGNNDDSTVIK